MGRNKQSADKGMKEILGLGDYGQKITDITKKYPNIIWKKRKLKNKGQKHNISEKNKETTLKQKIKGIISIRKLKGQKIIFNFSSSSTIIWSCFFSNNFFSFIELVVFSFAFSFVFSLGYVHWRDRRCKGGAPYRRRRRSGVNLKFTI